MLECPLDIPKSFKDKYDYQEKIVMENITIKDIVEACSGQLLCGDENKVIKEFSIDSRSGSEDSIFVPIIGERVDAHKFIDGALKINGATFTSEHDEPLEGFENKHGLRLQIQWKRCRR